MIWLALINPLTLLLVYILYAWLERRKQTGKLGNAGLAIYYPVLVIGALLDFIVNVTWFSVIFLEWPREWLLTERTERLMSAGGSRRGAAGYRHKLALLICRLLNYFLPGHCK